MFEVFDDVVYYVVDVDVVECADWYYWCVFVGCSFEECFDFLVVFFGLFFCDQVYFVL